MNLAEMVENVNVECHPNTVIDTSIKRWLNAGQKIVASKAPKHGWFWLRQFDYTFATTSENDEYALSPLVDTSKIIMLRDEEVPRMIVNMTDQYFRSFEPGPTATGDSYIYRVVGFSPVQNQPTSASVLTFVSDSVSDNQLIRIQGRDSSDVFIQETVTLNGTSSVPSTKSFAKVMSLSKSAATVGAVTCTSNAGVVTNVEISASSRSISHPIVKLFSIPDSVKTITYDFTMKMQNIVNDNDISLLPEQYHDVPELYAKHRCYNHLNNPQMAGALLQEFLLRIEDMKNDHVQPSSVWSVGSDSDDSIPLGVFPSNFPRTN